MGFAGQTRNKEGEMTRKVLFQFVNPRGEALSAAGCVDSTDGDATIARYSKHVKRKLTKFFFGIAPSDLTVYANRAAFDQKQESFEEDSLIETRGTSKMEALVVEVPRKEKQQHSGFWLATGAIENALNARGIRCRLYRLAGPYLGYYDSDLRPQDRGEAKALWYDNTMLRIISFLTQNFLREEPVRIGSPLYDHTVTSSVDEVGRVSNQLRRIYLTDYVARESALPQDTMSFLSESATTSVSIIDVMTDEFRYQRIEAEEYFRKLGKAERCHLMSSKHCRKHSSYHKYDTDPNNRLALSREMYGFYDGLSVSVPVMNIFVEAVSLHLVKDKRYEVKLIVRALDPHYGQLIARRLKEGAIVSADWMEMKTFVFVENINIFCECIEWKAKHNEKAWKGYFDMTPACRVSIQNVQCNTQLSSVEQHREVEQFVAQVSSSAVGAELIGNEADQVCQVVDQLCTNSQQQTSAMPLLRRCAAPLAKLFFAGNLTKATMNRLCHTLLSLMKTDAANIPGAVDRYVQCLRSLRPGLKETAIAYVLEYLTFADNQQRRNILQQLFDDPSDIAKSKLIAYLKSSAFKSSLLPFARAAIGEQ